MNKITKIFNNIGFYCSLNNDIFIDTGAIKSYQSLDHTSVGYYIPYLVRNIKDNIKWEIGVGEVILVDGKVCVKRNEVASSSNSNQKVNFTGNENEFYLFVNNINFNSSFNNVILKNDHFNIDNVTSIYLVDNSEKTIDCILPLANDARNVVIDIKALSHNHNVKIRKNNGEILSSTNDAIRLVSDGQSWYILNNVDSTINFGTLSLSDDNVFSSQSTDDSNDCYLEDSDEPGGEDYSFQYKDGNRFVGSELYWSSGNTNKLLLGSSSETNAHTIIPTSGSNPTIFNKDLKASDFIVYGSGAPQRNLFFSYDGRIGVNIPSGSRPQTIFHVVNYSCSEILRLENRTSCQPAKLTVFHKPSTLVNNSVCSILNLAGRDVAGNQKDYATISSIATDATNGFGALNLSISSGNIQQSLMSGDLSSITLGYSDSRKLNIDSNGSVNLSGSNINIRGSNAASINTNNASVSLNNNNIVLSHSLLDLGNGTITVGGNTTFNNTINTNNIRLPNIAPSSLLTLDSNNRIVATSGINISSGNIVLNNISANKFLSLDDNKNIVGLYDLNDYFLTEKDIVWNKYAARAASVCLKQVTFDVAVPAEEFSIGDQVEISTNNGLIYRIISSLDLNNNSIAGLVLDQNVTTDSVNNITVVSITKGGYLLIQKSTNGSVSDSSSNILSVRPFTETVFNTAQKDINFTIYGKDTNPAFKVHANLGSVNRASGTYYNYATQTNQIARSVINLGGSGISNTFSTANFNYDPNINQFSAKVSSVKTNGKSSFYGTFDQNGNVREWIEARSLNSTIYAAGGSYESTSGALRSYKELDYSTSYADVGFRIASITNLVDDPNISNLSFEFKLVDNPDNIADTGSVLFEDGIGQSNPINLGVVSQKYRISAIEVTNTQYVNFLNSAGIFLNNSISSGLYDHNMSGVLGGINIIPGNGIVSYSVKNNMGDKPVNFVSYLNSLRFINWLENGAPTGISSNNLDSIINNGAYELQSVDNNTFLNINPNRKYFLPSLNQWHKAAYFEYRDSVVVSGSPVITIGTDTPTVVATKLSNSLGSLSVDNNQPDNILANLTVSGWLVVDKIIVRDGAARSKLPPGFKIPGDPDPPPDDDDDDDDVPGPQTDGPIPPPTGESKDDKFWLLSDRVSPREDGSYGTRRPPIPPDVSEEMRGIDCLNDELIESNNIPFWCEPDGILKGPRFYP